MEKTFKYKPPNKEELKKLVDDSNVNLGEIDTSLITNMEAIFYSSKRKDFSVIEKWNVSNVTSMRWMFSNSIFNSDISNWDVSNVENMNSMFAHSKFNGDISKWDVSDKLKEELGL